MTRRWFLRLVPALLVFRRALARGSTAQPSPVLRAMKDELTRSMAALKREATPPYFLSYEITEVQSVSVAGSFGSVTSSEEDRSRLLDIDIRVGDYDLDNTRPLRGTKPAFEFEDRSTQIQVPLDDDPDPIRSVLWDHTDRAYKRALENFIRIKTGVRVKLEQEDRSADLSREPPEGYQEEPRSLRVDRLAWEGKVRRYGAPFARADLIHEAQVTLAAWTETRWFVNSEGSEIQTSQAYSRLLIAAETRAEDGMELSRHESFFAAGPEGLPDAGAVLKAVDRMIRDLAALRKAPVIEPYTGPAILSGRASGVFFHEVFGHRIEGHRQKDDEDAQTFKKKLNERVLPRTFSVYFDPTLSRLGEATLTGSYRYDNQGVRARRVAAVQHGVFKAFLMSRTPIEGVPASNGHGRKQPGYAAVARQSNLIVQVSKPVTRAQLKRMLIARVKRERKPFGLLFDDVQGGFTLTGRTFPNAFNVLPVMVYRVYPDGREELVRGANLIGTPLTTFSKIIGGGDRPEVFNGLCGAESGWVPVSSVSPAILVSQVEVQKSEKSPERPPLLPAPPLEGR